MKDFCCPNCEFLLGKTDGDFIYIKRKDLYVEVKGAMALIVKCRRCGKSVDLTKEEAKVRVVKPTFHTLLKTP